MVTPFLKWAGGKRWLVQNHADLFPKKFNRYIEPFLGSGAVFFYLEPEKAILSDANGRLIETYQAIKENYKLVEKHLREHQRKHSKEHYYSVRSKSFQSKFTRAGQFIYLNRTCWNGLYRENKKGIFNVPIGTKKNVLLKTDDFKAVANILKKVELKFQDFEKSISIAKDGDFIFVDPPYTVAHNNNGFVKYNQNIFSWADQERLKECLKCASDRGAEIVLTNANHDSVINLYENETIRQLNRKTVISGINSGRSKTSELIINFR